MRTSTKPTPSIDHTRGWLVPLLGVNLTGIVLALGFPPLIGVALLVALIGNIWVCTRLRAVLIALAHAYDQNGRQAAHHAALLNAAADAILICKNNGAIREANPAAARLFGYHRDELKSRSIRDLLPDTSLNVVKTDCYELFGTVSAFQGRRKDGKAFPVSVALSKVRLDNEGLYVVIVHDLTALHQARDEAQMATRAKSAFLLAASHELRTPLNGIMGAAELLSHTALDSTQRQLVETLSYCGEELQTSVEQVIDFSKLESGQVRLESTAFAPDEVFDALDRTWRPRAEAKGLRFTVRASLPSQIMGDSARLSHLVGWLIENAIVAQAAAVSPCPSSGGFVEVWATTEGNAITICVKDERPIRAMSEEQSEGVKGLRLGVSLAIRLTRLMGGSIALDSVAGRGRVFQVRLPLVLPGTQPPPTLAALVAALDDGERAAIECVLRDQGLEPVGVATGRAALQELMGSMVSGRPVGLVVMDGELVDISTEEWLRSVGKQANWNGPVVMLSDSPTGGECPEGVTAILLRDESHQTLGQWLREQWEPGQRGKR